MKANSFLPVGITDFQGPLTTANQLMGYDKLIYLMHDDPDAMHELMDKVTETLIRWVKTQKDVIGEPLTECIGDQQVYTGENAGVWFSDDDAVLMSAKTYREFVVPYNSRILEAFGGGCIHYCGNATHHADSFLATKGLKALNIYNLYNIPSVEKLQRTSAGQGRVVRVRLHAGGVRGVLRRNAVDARPPGHRHLLAVFAGGRAAEGRQVRRRAARSCEPAARPSLTT